MTVHFTSDLHLGHRSVAYQRRYGHWPEDREMVTPDDLAWHDDMLAENWDKTVGEHDVVWVLGDLIANPKSLDDALFWVTERPGIKHLILGNHDPAHPMNRDAHRWQHRYYDAFYSVQQSARRKIGQQDVLLSHFPYTGDTDGKEDRYSQWRLRNEGLPILHGHVHSRENVTRGYLSHPPGQLWAPQIHVGVDAHDFTPVSLEEIGELLT